MPAAPRKTPPRASTSTDNVGATGEFAGHWLSRISRLRDGGTTIINTELGELFVPSPLRGDPYEPGGVTFGGSPYTLMDIGLTTAELTSEGLVLR